MTTITKIARNLRTQLGAPGLKTKRACDLRDILIAIRESQRAKSRVRVYSDAGFVPNSYRYKCLIQFVEGVKTDDGWQFYTGWTGAQRSGGNGSLLVVQ
ncbi:MAG: hypothetical protein NTU93_12420 [Arthrobacter sp.]|nr:hypothetical protein [Arthrobacter sp.]